LAAVNPTLAARIRALADQLEPMDIRVTAGLRSWSEQETDWLQGRDDTGQIVDPSKIITDAPPGKSWHQYGYAADLVPMINGEPDWNIKHSDWTELIDACASPSLGLRSGSTFEHLKDNPHIQLLEITESPTDEDVQELKDSGMEAYWVAHPPN
jgi:peptidoglycan L-alanyl-D-glutamate endopeptidase CwlK